jgi:hypothetical protein
MLDLSIIKNKYVTTIEDRERLAYYELHFVPSLLPDNYLARTRVHSRRVPEAIPIIIAPSLVHVKSNKKLCKGNEKDARMTW